MNDSLGNSYRPHTKYGAGNVFTGVCLCTCVCGGGGGRSVWGRKVSVRLSRGRGVCFLGELGVSIQGEGGRCPREVSVTEDRPYIYDSGRYASYWNAFLLSVHIPVFFLQSDPMNCSCMNKKCRPLVRSATKTGYY